MFEFFPYIGWLLVLIGVMILIHELGHYWAAVYFDVRVETFSFGFGPRLFGYRRGETDFRVSAIPFGGYVKMMGEQVTDEPTADPRSFVGKPRWQRLIIAFAGPFMNIILAVALLTGLFMFHYPKVAEPPAPGVVGLVLADSPAAQAGIKEGDRIVEVEGVRYPTWEQITLREIQSADRDLPVKVERDGQEIALAVRPKFDPRTSVGMAGWMEQSQVQIADVSPDMDAAKKGLQRGDIVLAVNDTPIRSSFRLIEMIKRSEGRTVDLTYLRDDEEHTVTLQPQQRDLNGEMTWMIGVSLRPPVTITQLGVADALTESVRYNIKSAGLIFTVLRGLVEQRLSPKAIEGPIRIAQVSRDAAREGPASFIMLMALVSLNLAIFNLLPIPVLDGGVILLLLVEMVTRRELSLQVKETVIKLGFVFLMMVVVFVLYNDITKIITNMRS
jgi:regulator of sigma E protease